MGRQDPKTICGWCDSKLDKNGQCDVCQSCQECGDALSDAYGEGEDTVKGPRYCANCSWCYACQKWEEECVCPPAYDTFPLAQDESGEDAIKLREILTQYARINEVAL